MPGHFVLRPLLRPLGNLSWAGGGRASREPRAAGGAGLGVGGTESPAQGRVAPSGR